MELVNGEYTILLNGINHWVKIDGSQNRSIPLIIIPGGPGENHYTFERTVGPLLAKKRTIVYYEQKATFYPVMQNNHKTLHALKERLDEKGNMEILAEQGNIHKFQCSFNPLLIVESWQRFKKKQNGHFRKMSKKFYLNTMEPECMK